MGSIYSSATGAIVDPGDVAMQDTRFLWYHGLNLMNKLAILRKFAPKTKGIDLRGREDLVRFGLPDEDHGSWLLFGSLFGRPWFCRTWIVQEVVLASEVHCRYGQFTFPWKLLKDALSFLIKRDMFIHRYESETMRMGKLNARRIMELRQYRKGGTEESNFLPPLHILHRTREFLATQLNNLILGTLGPLPPSSLFGEHGFVFDASWQANKGYHRFAAWLV